MKPVLNAAVTTLEWISSLAGLVTKWRTATTLPLILVLGIGLFLRFDGFSSAGSRRELDKLAEQAKSQQLSDVYYKGRKGDYDYFELMEYMAGTTKVHLKVDESPVVDPFPYTSNKDEWRSGLKTGMKFSKGGSPRTER
ncbi:MAG: hypothetical protein WCK77_22195 [Verrucomicrobiota bacterium]